MLKPYYVPAFVTAAIFSGAAFAQYPIADMVANNVVLKYQNSTCEQLWKEKEAPKTPQQKEAMQMLRSNPQIRTYFIDKIAGPVVNKMFECGMIP